MYFFNAISLCSRKYCSSAIIDDNELSSAHNILSTTKFEKTKQLHTINNIPKSLLLINVSSYLSIFQMHSCTYLRL